MLAPTESGTRENEAENRSGAGCPQQSGSNTEQEGVGCAGGLRPSFAACCRVERGALERRSASDEKSSVRPKTPKRTSAAIRPNWLALTAQPPSDSRQAGNHGERDCHARQQRQSALAKGLVGACKDEGQDGEDTRTQGW